MTNAGRYADQLSLLGLEADVYEAIATLEFLGRPVSSADVLTATSVAGLDETRVAEALRSLTERGLLTVRDDVYEPAQRGWSAAPEQPANRQR